jgi:uncharacterized protein
MSSTRPALAVPLWFGAALMPLVAAQILRLDQTSPLAWLISDYIGRLGALSVLWIIPAARTVAFAPQRLKVGAPEAILWVIALTAVYLIIDRPLSGFIDSLLPGTRLGSYPVSHGWLHTIDITFGLALVAYQEELIFRRCGRLLFCNWLGDGWGMIIATSLLFASYHWWSGIGNMVTAMSFGIGAMLVYRRTGALWPVVASHYLSDLASFG